VQQNISECLPQSNCYKALIKPLLEHESAVWSPYTKRDIDVIEKKMGSYIARFVMDNYSQYTSVTEILTLTRYRDEQKATMLFKNINLPN